jgi:hypothetical protein
MRGSSYASGCASANLNCTVAEKQMVRMKGLEPSLPFGNQNLNLARLPVSPHPHDGKNLLNYNNGE